MKAYLEPLKEISEYCEVEKVLLKGKKAAHVTGCIDSQKCHLIAGLSEHFPVRLIITYSDLKAQELCEEYRLYDANVVRYPSKDIIFYNADIHGNAIVKERLCALKKLMSGEPVTIRRTGKCSAMPAIKWHFWESIHPVTWAGFPPLSSTFSTSQYSLISLNGFRYAFIFFLLLFLVKQVHGSG